MPIGDFEYDETVSHVTGVRFGILSPERIKKMSVCEIYKHITNIKNLEGTLMDLRMGPIERGQICPTCGYTYKDCPGHFGHLVLAKPVIQVQFYDLIIKLLGCFCLRCSSLLASTQDPEVHDALATKTGKNRYAYMIKKCQQVKNCPNCGAEKPKIKRDKEGIFRILISYAKDKDKDKSVTILNPEMIHNIFKNITDADVEAMGLNPQLSRPEWTLWTIMPIPPLAMRPSVKADNGKLSDDDLTHKLNDIIKFNNQLRIKMEDDSTKQSFIDGCWQLIQYHVATYIDNEISSLPRAQQRSGRPLKTLRQRIKAKEGRVRGNLMGKRVDGSGRSVITPDPYLSIDQLGIPRRIAMNLTYPELVTPYNITQMTQLVRNGPSVYPGAKSYKGKLDQYRKQLKYVANRDSIVLQPGDIVYRHLMDNDWILFNRQPSLHKMSMMAHRAKILDHKTFRFSANVCAPYNADFDGDEMNIHVPQTLESVAELRYLTSVPTQIVSPQASKPVMGLVQDSLLGCYLLTRNQKLTRWEMIRLIASISTDCERLPMVAPYPDPRWSGQQMVSLYLPPIAYKDSKVEINGGQMVKGVLDSNTVGKKNNSLFHITWNDYGPTATRHLFDHTSWSAITYLQICGFSCGIADCIIPPEKMEQIRGIVLKYKATVAEMIGNAKLGILPKGFDAVSYKRNFSKKIVTNMNKCRGDIEEIAKQSIKSTNSIGIMVDSGSKGSKNNIGQIVAMIGQQEIEGDWITDQYYRRTLPHMYKDDYRPEAHGFVEDSFMSGLSPTEYWFHAQEGRVGLITKAIKTAETGYLQRKLIKILEDVRICYDGTVRNANNMIIQIIYGGDGFDASYLETQNLFFINFNMERIQHVFNYVDVGQLQKIISSIAYQRMLAEKDHLQIIKSEFTRIVEYYHYLKENVPSQYLFPDARAPINFKRLINNMIDKYGLREAHEIDLNPVEIIREVDALRNKMVVEDHDQKIQYVSTIIVNALMSIYLSSKVLIYEHRFTRVAFNCLLENIYAIFLKAVVNPGDNVGIIAAQSLGEPTTQMALNTFHYTGQGSKANISRGTPRLREILGLTKNIKTPSMTIHLYDQLFIQKIKDNPRASDINLSRAEYISAGIEYTSLRDILLRTEIYYDDDDRVSCVPEDQEFIDSYYDLIPDEQISEAQTYRWMLRLEFNREQIMKKVIPMALIAQRLDRYLTLHNITHSVIVNDDNAKKLICRIKVEASQMDGLSDPINYLRELSTKLLDLQIKGIENVTVGLVNPIKKAIVLPDGAIISPFDPKVDYEAISLEYNNLKFVIDTEGTNLLEVLRLPSVDQFHTVSNDVWEIYRIYGIEAARKCLITEINQLLEYNATYIQERHISLLIDVMTSQGNLVSVDRHGMGKTDSGPLHRASFEETTTQLTNASIFNEEDLMTGVSSNIMFGQFIPTGTNAFRIAMDLDRVMKQPFPEQPVLRPTPKKETLVTETPIGLVDYCADDNFEFNFHLNPKTEF